MQYRKEIQTAIIVGAGNLGWHMAQAVSGAGIKIRYIASGNRNNASELASRVGAVPVSDPQDMEDISDLCLLCVSDSLIQERAGLYRKKCRILVHCSGSTGMDVLQETARDYGVFYPLQTFTRGIAIRYAEIPFLLEASSPVVFSDLKGLADKISGKSYSVDTRQRRIIHIAAVFACNFSNHMAAIAQLLLEKEGMGMDLLRPLITETTGKIARSNPNEVQTGPAARGDEVTLKKHLESLMDLPSEQELYRLISNNIKRYNQGTNE